MQNVGPLIVSIPKVLSGIPAGDPGSGFAFAGIIGPETPDPTGGTTGAVASANIDDDALVAAADVEDTVPEPSMTDPGSIDDGAVPVAPPTFWQVIVPHHHATRGATAVDVPQNDGRVASSIAMDADASAITIDATADARAPVDREEFSPSLSVRSPAVMVSTRAVDMSDGGLQAALGADEIEGIAPDAPESTSCAAPPLRPRDAEQRTTEPDALPTVPLRDAPIAGLLRKTPDAGAGAGLTARDTGTPVEPATGEGAVAAHPGMPAAISGMTISTIGRPHVAVTPRAMVLVAELARVTGPAVPAAESGMQMIERRTDARVVASVDAAPLIVTDEAWSALPFVDGLTALPPGPVVSVPAAPNGAIVPLPALPQLVAVALRDDPARQVEFRLDPPELGAVRFQMDQRSNDLVITIIAERPETLDLMRRHGEQLLADLRQAGFQGASLNFGSSTGQGHLGQGGFGSHGQGSAPPADPNAPPPAPGFAAPTPPPPRTAKGGLNLRL